MKAQVFFPASKFDFDLLHQGQRLAQTLELDVLVPPPPEPHHFQCGRLSKRRLSFMSALKGTAEILWAARGGFGTAQWLSDLPKEPRLWQDKRVVGFSDLTALHAWCSNHNLPSFHAPMIATQGWVEATPEELDSWKKAILENRPNPLTLLPQGEIPLTSGRLVGGNLTVLASLMGTPHQLRLLPGDLLFLEDVQEPSYRLARSLFQLSHSPHFQDVQIIWGQLTSCGEDEPQALIPKLMEPFSNPWAMGLEAGHGRPNHSIRLGHNVSIEGTQLRFPLGE